MQEDALKLVLLALEDGSALSRKVLVLFVVQKLEARFPQASKTSIGHVVQLLYRASCFKVPAEHIRILQMPNDLKHDQPQTGIFWNAEELPFAAIQRTSELVRQRVLR